jgi:hypothetical protein
LKLKIGTGTPVEGTTIELDGPMLKLWLRAGKGGQSLVLAYHLHPGEIVRGTRVDGEEFYEVTQ